MERRVAAEQVNQVLVLGAGVMGAGIAQSFAQAGIQVRLVDRSGKTLSRSKTLTRLSLNVLADYGTIQREEVETIVSRIHASTDLEAMAVGVDFAIEAMPETADVKRKTLARLDSLLSRNVTIASNTSGVDIFSITGIQRPERILIAHWFLPSQIMPLVEVVPGPLTSQVAIAQTVRLMQRIGKKTLVMKEFLLPFVVNRIQDAMAAAMFEILERGWVSPEELDLAIKLTVGIRLPVCGIAQIADFFGLDSLHDILNRTGIRHGIVEERVKQGHFGVRTGRGIYDYGGRGESEVLRKRDFLLLRMIDHLESIGAFDPI